jgi:hypothetical protein
MKSVWELLMNESRLNGSLGEEDLVFLNVFVVLMSFLLRLLLDLRLLVRIDLMALGLLSALILEVLIVNEVTRLSLRICKPHSRSGKLLLIC